MRWFLKIWLTKHCYNLYIISKHKFINHNYIVLKNIINISHLKTKSKSEKRNYNQTHNFFWAGKHTNRVVRGWIYIIFNSKKKRIYIILIKIGWYIIGSIMSKCLTLTQPIKNQDQNTNNKVIQQCSFFFTLRKLIHVWKSSFYLYGSTKTGSFGDSQTSSGIFPILLVILDRLISKLFSSFFAT